MNRYTLIRAMISSSMTFLASSGLITASPKGAGASPYNQVKPNAKEYIENYHVLVLKSVAFEESCDEEKVEKFKMKFKTRNGAFQLVWNDLRFLRKQDEPFGNESKNSAVMLTLFNDGTVEIDLDNLIEVILKNKRYRSISEKHKREVIEEVIKELIVVFEFIINENNRTNGEIIEKPDYATKIVSHTALCIIMDIFGFLCSDNEVWKCVLGHFKNTIVNLSDVDFDTVVSILIDGFANLITTSELVDDIKNINITKFSTNLSSFIQLCGEINLLDYEMYLRSVDKFVFVYARGCLKSPNNEVVKLKNVKSALLKLFVKSNPFSKTDLFKEQNITNEELRGYFYIISSFTPSEFYDLVDLEEFTYLEEYLDYYLSTFLGFECVLASTSECGTIPFRSKIEIFMTLQDSGSFLVKHFVVDKKVWIHFGCSTMKIINEQPNKAFIYIFWRVLRNYVVLLGGDGILMTFEDGEKVNNPAEETPESAIFKLRSCGYWNLIDPEVEGKVVVHKGKSMKIVYNEEKCHNIILEIDGSNNLMPLYSKSSPEIVVFYRSREMKRNETCDLIRALPGCIFSEAIEIGHDTGDDFDSEKIKKACEQMCGYEDILKVSILFDLPRNRNTSYEIPLDTNEPNKQIIRDDSENVVISRPTARNMICSALLKLNEEKKNFRELSIEAFQDDYDRGFAELLEKLELTSLHYSSQFASRYSIFFNSSYCKNAQILAAITENKFMKENLEHFSCFPPFDIDEFVSEHISQLIRLKKIALSLHDENCSNFLITILKKNTNLVEIELLHDYQSQVKTYKFLRCLIGKKILRLSILGHIEKCEVVMKSLFKHIFGILQSLKSMHVVTTSDYRELCGHLSQHLYITEHVEAWRNELREAGFKEHYIKRLSKKRLLGFRMMSSFDPERRRNSLIKRYLSVN